MIDGITVLAQHSPAVLGSLIVGIILFATVAIFFVTLVFISLRSKEWKASILCCVVAVIFLYGIYLLIEDTRSAQENIEYIVTIDDSVSFKEFYNKYEIIEVNGDLYTIKERE